MAAGDGRMNELDTDQPGEPLQSLDRFLAINPKIHFVRLLWLDYVSTLRGRVLPATHFRSLVASKRFYEVGRCFVCLPDDSGPWYEEDAAAAVGKLALIPDFASLIAVPGYEGHASVLCYLGDEQASSAGSRRPRMMNMTLSPICPRSALFMAATAAEDLDISILVGIEIEFVVLQTDNNGTATMPNDPTHQASSIRTLEARMMPIFDSIVLALARAGVSVQHYQSEGAKSQYEIALAPLPPMRAADAFLTARECMRSICHQHSLVATLHPSCAPIGSGLHIHISANGAGCKDEHNYQSFLAGMLAHLPALCALGMTTPMSYARSAPSMCGSGQWVAWGTQNRQTAVRGIEDNHWELKAVDGLSCIYLVIAGYIHCAIEGVRSSTELAQVDCPVDPAFLTEEQRHGLHIDVKLPESLVNAVELLEKDDTLVSKLGSTLVDAYCICTKAYARFLEKLADEDGIDAQFQHVVQRI